MIRGLVALVALVAALCARTATADPLGDAKAQVAASDYLKARGSLDAAIASGTNSPVQLAEVWRLRGIVAGALGETKPATEAFQRCLALDPRAELPPGTSPKIMRPFAAAQAFYKSAKPLAITKETTQAPSIVVVVESDPMVMIKRIQVAVKVDGAAEQLQHKQFAGQERVEISLPAGARLDLRVAALDEHGNRLAELGSAEVPIVIVGSTAKPDPVVVVTPPVAPAKPRPSEPTRARPLYAKWWLWGGGAIVLAGGATYFGLDGLARKSELEDLNASSPSHTFDEAKRVERRARRDFLLANIGFGVAGALAVTAAILFITEPSGKETARVGAAPLDGGGAIVFGGSF